MEAKTNKPHAGERFREDLHSKATASGQAGASAEADDDDVLAQAAATGNIRAFERLVIRYQTRTYNLVVRYVGDAALARDVTQNTFFTLHKKLPDYEPRGTFRSYLMGIAMNHARAAMRTAWVRRVMLAAEEEKEMAAPPSSADDAHDLTAAIAKLRPKLRAVVAMYYGEGMTTLEISDALHIPLGTVKRRLFDALGILRGYLEAT